MKKEQILFALIFTALIFNAIIAAAEIIITKQPLETYLENEKIPVGVSLINMDKNAIFSSSIICNNFELEYFNTPSNGEAIQNLVVPEFPISEVLKGICRIDFKVKNFQNQILEEKSSQEFKIFRKIILSAETDKTDYLPEEQIKITGHLAGKEQKKLSVELKKNSQSIKKISQNVKDKISSSIAIPADIAGAIDILISADDSAIKDEKTLRINVLQIPKTIKINLEKNSLYQSEETRIGAFVFDQENNLFNSSVNIQIINPANEKIYSGSSELLFQAKQFDNPGTYKILAKANSLSAEASFTIKEKKSLELIQKDSKILIILNSGNVAYNEEISIHISNSEASYLLPISLSLPPNKTHALEAKDFIPIGLFNITLSNSTILNFNNAEDNRNTQKKLSQGFRKLTGTAIINATDVKPAIFGLFLVLAIGFITLYLAREKMKENFSYLAGKIFSKQRESINTLQQSITRHKADKSFLKSIFSKYVDADILPLAKTGIEKKEISVLFTDIRGFAALFDKLDEKEISAILNMYFSKTSEIIKRNSGFINKFIGDSVMAIFNAPREQKNHISSAVKSALEIRKEIAILNERLKIKNMRTIEVGIGIDTGAAAVGNIGSEEKTEYTAIGIPVNIAFRLQALGKETQILITERLYEKIKQYVKAECIGTYELKNISNPVKVYNILGLKTGQI